MSFCAASKPHIVGRRERRYIMDVIFRLLDFWFRGDQQLPKGTFRDDWFQQSDAFDAELRDGFLEDFELACLGEYDDLVFLPEGALALVLFFDQLPRNLFRDKPRAFATDQRALAIAEHALRHRFDEQMTWTERLFLYLPYQHAEDIEMQEKSMVLFQDLASDPSVKAAEAHLDIIRRFGRFPHRNEVLGRESTREELAFLAEHGRGF